MKKDKASKCILPSELTPEQVASLPFVPDVVNSFDEKEKLPPTARAQWTYIQLNPIEYLGRFKAELGLIGTEAAICFINKEIYHDRERDLQTPISVNLIVSDLQFEDVKSHLEEKKLSYQLMEDNKGFILPYLGSIQKALDTLSLQSLVHFVFIKNSISREAYSIWISIPQFYLEQKSKLKTASAPEQIPLDEADIREQVAKALQEENAKEEQSNASSISSRPSESKDERAQENFNYVIYDDTGETVPPLPVEKTAPGPQSVIVTNEVEPKKENFISKLTAKFARKKQPKSSKKEAPSPSPCSTARSDSFLFLSLSLFNFYCSVLLLNFLGKIVEVISDMMLEAVSFSALMSLLIVIFVIRPSFKLNPSRFWALSAYVVYAMIAAYQIYQSSNYPESSNYLIPTAIALVCLITALISAFLRIDRISLRKSAPKQEEETENDETEQVSDDTIGAPSATSRPSVRSTARLPAPSASKATIMGPKKIELKASKNNKSKSGKQEESGKEEQAAGTEALRNRLARKELLSRPSIASGAPSSISINQSSSDNPDQKPLSAEEIKAKFASRLKKTRAMANLSNHTNPDESEEGKKLETPDTEPKDLEADKSEAPQLETPEGSEAKQEKTDTPSNESGQPRTKLSLPNSNM